MSESAMPFAYVIAAQLTCLGAKAHLASLQEEGWPPAADGLQIPTGIALATPDDGLARARRGKLAAWCALAVAAAHCIELLAMLIRLIN